MSCSKPAHKSSVVMIMAGDFSHELKIPPANVKQFNELSSEKLVLKISMRTWGVHLKSFEGGLKFGEGWRDFVEDNSIEANDLLYFKLNGSRRVNVMIYCRKERPAGKSVETRLDKKIMKHESTLKKLCNLENVELPNSERIYKVVDQEDDMDVHFYSPSAALSRELQNVCDKSGREEDISIDKLKGKKCHRKASNKADKDLLQSVVETIEVDVNKQLILEGGEVNPRTLAELSAEKVKTNSANRKCQSTEAKGCGHSSKKGRSRVEYTGESNGHGQLSKVDASRDEDIDEDISPLSYIMGKGAGSNGHDYLAKAYELRVEDTDEQDAPVIYRKRKAYAGKRLYKKGPVKKKAAGLDKPKRFLTAFFVFMEEFRQMYKKDHPTNKDATVVGRAAGEKWRNMSVAEKAPYAAEALARKNLHLDQTKQAEERIVEDKEEAEPKSEVNNEIDEELGYTEGDSDKDEELRDDEENSNEEDDEDGDEVRQEKDGGGDDEEKSNEEDDKEEDEEVDGEVDQVEDTDFSDYD